MDMTSFWVDSFEYDYKNPEKSFQTNKILAFISEKVGRPISEISKKSQLRYLIQYLASNHVQAKTLVIETEYIDKHYLEDYSEYYSRCFSAHSRVCSRIHFFSEDFNEIEFIKVIEGKELSKAEFTEDRLKDSYLGYCIIRPIPETFLGRVCLKYYSNFEDSLNHKIISQKNSISLFGIKLEVQTTPICEQDKVVSACATSAVWSLLKGYGHLSSFQTPSLSKITKTASEADMSGTRTFPVYNLKPNQVSHVLKEFGLEPISIGLNKVINIEDKIEIIKRCINAYVSAGIPVMLGGSVIEEKEGSTIKIGDHLVTILGYEKNTIKDDDITDMSVNIEKCYVHDDRYGQYLRVSLNNPKELKKDDDTFFGLQLSNYESSAEYFVPSFLMIGVYHKIRLRLWDINNFSDAFTSFISNFYDVIDSDVIQYKEPTKTGLLDSFKAIKTGAWDIQIIDSCEYKAEISSSPNIYSSSFGENVMDICAQHMPRYLWKCSLKVENGDCFDMLFDATEIMQGHVFLGYVSYDANGATVWMCISQSSGNKSEWAKITSGIPKGLQKYINSFLSRLSIEKNVADELYGKPQPPRRNLKSGEIDQHNNITHPPKNIRVIKENGYDLSESDLKKKVKYIWVVTKHTDLVIGEDLRRFNHTTGEYDFEGHPTLANYEFARVAGELYYSDHDTKGWTLNCKSGTYSRHLNSEVKRKAVLRSVKNNLFKGFVDGNLNICTNV